MEYYDGVQTLLKGRLERIYSEYRDNANALFDPTSPKVEIYKPDGTVLTSAVPTRESTGVYYYVVSISTAASSQEGMYAAYWQGYISGSLITMDLPQYFWVQAEPQESVQKSGEEFVQAVRRFIGDTNPANYRIATYDIRYFIKDAIAQVQSIYPMGYSVTVTPSSITFSSTPTQIAETLFKIKTAELIIRHILGDVLFSGGNISLGDVKINMNEIIRSRRDYIKDLEASFKDLIRELSIDSSTYYGGYLVNNYLLENEIKYNLNYLD